MMDPVPIRSITVGCGTPVQPISKVCQLGIEHLTSKDELPRNCKSTKEVLETVIEINENNTPLPEDTVIVSCDVSKMYPNVDVEEALSSVERRLQTNPSPLGLSPATIVSGLRICMRCNCVQFKDKFYLPNRGVAQGACHACDFSDIWMGDITQKHLDTCPVDTLHFSLYRDDGLDFMSGDEEKKEALKNHLNNLHPNLTWTVECAKETGYLDLWLMIENGRIEWRNYRKAPPIYVGPDSCHDPAVTGAIVKGVGHRGRINSSKDEYFEDFIEDTARSFKISGYNYQKTKQELRKFKDLDPIELIKKKKIVNKGPEKGAKAFFITDYDPRVLHPRQLISNNYHHIESSPQLAALFPRKNLVGATRRLKNLSELLSPTVQAGPAPGGDRSSNAGVAPGDRYNGSYHCASHRRRRNGCDVCSYSVETSYVTSLHYKRKFAIHGRNIHLPASQKNKMKWFVYLVEDTACQLQYVGSTSDVTSRWSNTKGACLHRNSDNTRLYKHFQEGCPRHLETGDVDHLTHTLVDFMVTSKEKLDAAGHQGGNCRCSECQKLKDIEDKWMTRLGTLDTPTGLNFRDEIIARSRVNHRHVAPS